MVPFVRLFAAALFTAGLAAAAPAAHAQTDALQTAGPLGANPAKARPKQTTIRKRAKRPTAEGRQITVRKRPSWLTAGTQVPVGSVGNGYVYDTFAQPTPVAGTFMGMRGQERITDQFGNAGPGLTLFRF